MLTVGKIVNVHGIAGEVKILPWTDFPEDFYEFTSLFIEEKNGTKQEYKIKQARVHKGCVLVKFFEINDRNAAERLKNINVLAKREEVPIEEGRHFIVDLLGLSVKTEEELLGELIDIFNTGANDVYSVRRENGKMLYIPVIPSVVKEINTDDGYILVSLPDGLLEV